MTTILVADDDPDMRALVKSTLDQEAYEFIEAVDGDSDYATAVSEKPDVILLDVTMPAMNGFQVLEMLKSNPDTRPIPVILLTVRRQPKDEARGMRAGAIDYITKPFSRSELPDRVRLALTSLDVG